jgi:hypothetical protein
LEYWRNRCLECCSNLGDGIHWGDQKYLEELVDKFSCVHVCQNNGAGVAPWNISLYKVSNKDDRTVFFKPLKTNIEIVFYHYQGVTYKNHKVVSTAVNAKRKDVDYSLVDKLYYHYLDCIDEKKMMLANQYGIDLLIKIHPSNRKETRIRALFHKTLAYKLLIKLFQIYSGELYSIVLEKK